jgi:hypothetical protein
VILPFRWIAKHPPSRQYEPPKHIHFLCKNCRKAKADEFSIEYDNKVMHNPADQLAEDAAAPENEEELPSEED